jgi:acyl-CoA reductase-like NAD-dependent aldehyde dehydrogenase
MSLLPATSERLLLIDGQWTAGASRIPVFDKYHLEACCTLHVPSREQAAAAVAAADRAFRAATATPYERGLMLDRAALGFERRSDDLIVALRQEAGFTHADAIGEIKRCVETFRLSAQEARSFSGEMVPLAGAPNQGRRIGFTMRVPLGVVCAITPFNAPLNTVGHKVAPALAAGNAVILKPSAHTPTSANIMAEVLLEAGLAPGMMSVLHGGVDVVHWLLDEAAVRFYAFTGSTQAGREIQSRAGLRRTQMELGSIAFTILAEDANLELALPKVINAGYRKAGQVCTSIQTLLVHASIVSEVSERLAAMVQALPYGDPADAATVVGPVISEAAAQRIEQWVEAAVAGGARRLAGGARRGAVVPPTLLVDVDAAMQVSCSEIFGPVMSIVAFATLEEACERVNATPFGLATGIFTNRLDDALHVARTLQVGGVHINETSSSRADVMPYGGSKDSGFGREGPHHAIREMSEERLVTILA